ncbi:hypothetical protein MPSEU_001011200 [Mayamaea pseudoterrestris]|nr:hypothetical protein MPSEU_001011200 [Mayamaea pseudoterrestris]
MTNHQTQQQSLASLAEEVVQRIENVIQSVRQTPAFAIASKENPFQFPLYSQMETQGLVQAIHTTCHKLAAATNNKSILSENQFILQSPAASERSLFVRQVLLPLLQALWRCYQALDNESSSQELLQQSTDTQEKVKKPVVPPPGLLLSLRNYTDIACLLELTVATAILPLVDDHILHAPKTYARTLPNALKGRIPPKSLVWWMRDSDVTEPYDENGKCTASTLELKETTMLLAQVILLDRFRPMLLPRHLSHIYAAILQVEDNLRQLRSESDNALQLQYDSTWQSTLGQLGLDDAPSEGASTCIIDQALIARTYQTLLAQGMAAPAWLRHKVAPRLSSLPLRVLLKIFQGDGAAAMRLARAVIAGTGALMVPMKSAESATDKIKSICSEMGSLLDEYEEHEQGLGEAQRFKLETIWSMINLLLPDHLPAVMEGLCCGGCYASIILRFGALLTHIPPFVQPNVLALLLFRPATGVDSLSVFDLSLRVAAIPSILHLTVKHNAQLTLELMMRSLLGLDKHVIMNDVLIVAIVSAHINEWDIAGNQLDIETSGQSDDVIEYITIRNLDETLPLEAMVKLIEERSKILVDVLSTMIAIEAGAANNNDRRITDWVSGLFLLSLTVYFMSEEKEMQSHMSPAFRSASCRLISMVLLPLLCESLPLESLLAGDATILEMMKVVFDAAACKFSQQESSEVISAELDILSRCMERMNEAFDTFQNYANRTKSNLLDDSSAFAIHADGNYVTSVCTILLSLLIGMLELGADRRTDQDEQLLQSFVNPLGVLACASQQQNDDKLSDALPVESSSKLAELASHALALVVARQASDSTKSEINLKTGKDDTSLVSAIEHDLQSPEPPIRARAVVQLRHLAAACVEATGTVSLSDSSFKGVVWECLQLCVTALGDSESFVYLAAIQTVANIADMFMEVAQAVGVAVAGGVFYCGYGEASDLTNEERIKLTEALTLTIRRKAIVEGDLESLLDIITDAPQMLQQKQNPSVGASIHSETHLYFTQGKEEPNALVPDDERWAEMDIRLKTGGPLFVAEEGGLLRSGKLALVVELISKMHPASVARYSDALILCAIDIIRLDNERFSRRSGALLARELYNTLLREHAIADGYEFALQFVQGKEEDLAVMLKRCIGGQDLEDLEPSRQRLFDPATVARCKEAIALRNQAQDEGIFIAAYTAAEITRRDAAIPALLEPSISHEKTMPKSKFKLKFIKELN